MAPIAAPFQPEKRLRESRDVPAAGIWFAQDEWVLFIAENIIDIFIQHLNELQA